MGYDGEGLATTGAFGLTFFGTHIGLDLLVAGAAALIVLGAVLYRIVANRSHRASP